jgi:chaperonin cofactor prefoldin
MFARAQNLPEDMQEMFARAQNLPADVQDIFARAQNLPAMCKRRLRTNKIFLQCAVSVCARTKSFCNV